MTPEEKKNEELAKTAKGQEKLAAEGKGSFSNLQEKVTVYSTDKDKAHSTGDPIRVHPKVADRIVKDGLATRTAPGKKEKEEDEEETGGKKPKGK